MTSWSNFEGSTASTYIENQGLGERFFDLMYKNQEKLHQVRSWSNTTFIKITSDFTCCVLLMAGKYFVL